MNESIASRILKTHEYESGVEFSVREMQNVLKDEYGRVCGAIHSMAERGELTRVVRGNVTRFYRPFKHWIHRRRLVEPGAEFRRCIAERVWL